MLRLGLRCGAGGEGQIGSSRDEAHALAGLGRCALADGHSTQAQAFLRQSPEIFQKIGAPEASDISRELTAHNRAEPPA